MKYRSLFLIFLVIGLLFVGSASATNYYASPTLGSDSNDGLSTGAPFLSIQTGIDALSAGDTLYLMDGTWYDNSSFFNESGTEGNPITITNYTGAFPILQGDYNKITDSEYVAFGGIGKSYISISNIEIYDYRSGVWFDYNGVSPYHDITIDNLKIHDIYKGAIVIDPFGYDVLIDGCEVYDNDESGDGNIIGIYGTYPDKDSGLYTHDITLNDTWIHGHVDHSAIDLFGEMENITVTYNRIDTDSGSIYYHTTPTEAKNVLLYSNISYNTINTTSSYGINVLASNSTFNNNIITNTMSESIYLPTYANTTTSFYPNYNTISNNICDDGIKITGDENTVNNNSATSYGLYPFNDSVLNPVGTSYLVSRNSEPGTTNVIYTNGKVTSNTRNLPITFYNTNSTFSVGTLFATVTAYDLYLVPSSGYLDSFTEFNPSGDKYSFSISASEDSLDTTISATMEEANTNYTLSIDDSYIEIAMSDANGFVEFAPTALNIASQTIVIEQTPTNEVLEYQVSQSSDDAYEQGSGYFSLTTPIVTKTSDNTSSSNYIGAGIRFQNITIPDNATIESVTLDLYLTSTTYDNADLSIFFIKELDTETFSSASSDTKVLNRALTTNSTLWYEQGISIGWSSSPDITGAFNEVINQDGWTSGNDVSIILMPTVNATNSEMRANSYDDDSTLAPKLIIEYSIPTEESSDNTFVVATFVASSFAGLVFAINSWLNRRRS